MKRWTIVAGIGLAAVHAHAGPLADAIAHHTPADVAALRARLSEPDARCTLGAVYARRDDLPRALLYLDGCADTTLAPDIADAIARASRTVAKRVHDSDLSQLSIVTNPPGMLAETDALPGERVTTPVTIWVRAGTYQVRAAADGAALDGGAASTNSATVGTHSRGSVIVDVAAPKQAAARTGVVKFEDQGDVGDQQSAPPPPVAHKTLIPPHYIDGGTSAGPHIDDPLATEIDRPPPVPPALAIGARAGVASTASGIAPALAVTARLAQHAKLPFSLDARVDWSKPADAEQLALGLGAAKVIAAPDTAWITLGAELRAGAWSGGGMTQRVLGGAAALGLVLRRLPVALDARYEQGLTTLPDGSREHVVVVDAGFDLRWFR